MRLRPRLLSLAAVPLLLAIAVNLADADAIHFKNGTVLNNVRIIRDDWRLLDVQISETVRLSFQRQDIAKVERERHHAEPLAVRREYTGARVPTALSQKLAQEVRVNYQDPRDFVEILDNIGELYTIKITIHQKVKEGIAAGTLDPMWTFTKEDGRTVSDMIEKLVRDKGLAFEFQDGSILINLPQKPAAPTVPQQPPRVGGDTPRGALPQPGAPLTKSDIERLRRSRER